MYACNVWPPGMHRYLFTIRFPTPRGFYRRRIFYLAPAIDSSKENDNRQQHLTTPESRQECVGQPIQAAAPRPPT